MKRVAMWTISLFLSCVAGIAVADLVVLDGNSVSRTIFDFTCFTTKHCSAHVPINSAGTELATSSAPLRIDPTGTTTQPVSSTLSAETTKVIGTVRTLGNVGAVIDFAGQNASSPANSWLTGCQYNTTPTTITSGNASPCQVDNAGNLLVNVKTATGLAQGSTTSGQTGSLVMGAVTTSAPSYTTAQTSPVSLDTSGGLRVNTGTVTLAAETTKVIGTVRALGNAGAIFDFAGQNASSPANSILFGCQFNTTPTTITSGNASPCQVDNAGKLLVNPGTVTVTATNLSSNLAQVGGTTVVNGGVAGSQSIGGTVATNVAINANPLNLGAQAVSSENTAVTTARQVQLVADLVGKLIVMPYANPENFVSGVITTAMTGTTSTSLVAAPAAGLRNYITACTFSNAHATVGTDMILQDGSGGTSIWNIPAAAVYGGAHITFPTPLRQPTTATALYVANVTTGASTKAACSGYKGA